MLANSFSTLPPPLVTSKRTLDPKVALTPTFNSNGSVLPGLPICLSPARIYISEFWHFWIVFDCLLTQNIISVLAFNPQNPLSTSCPMPVKADKSILSPFANAFLSKFLPAISNSPFRFLIYLSIFLLITLSTISPKRSFTFGSPPEEANIAINSLWSSRFANGSFQIASSPGSENAPRRSPIILICKSLMARSEFLSQIKSYWPSLSKVIIRGSPKWASSQAIPQSTNPSPIKLIKSMTPNEGRDFINCGSAKILASWFTVTS